MLSITNGEELSRALSSSIDGRLKRLLRLRRDQLGGDITDQARFVVAQAHDTLVNVERAIGFQIKSNSYYGPEWAEDHGYAIELVWILTDDGYSHVLIVPREPGIDPALLDCIDEYTSA